MMVAEIVGAKIDVIPPTEYNEIPSLRKTASVLLICLMELDNNSPMGVKGNKPSRVQFWCPESWDSEDSQVEFLLECIWDIELFYL